MGCMFYNLKSSDLVAMIKGFVDIYGYILGHDEIVISLTRNNNCINCML